MVLGYFIFIKSLGIVLRSFLALLHNHITSTVEPQDARGAAASIIYSNTQGTEGQTDRQTHGQTDRQTDNWTK